MTGKIALEEHFIHPDFVEYLGKTAPNISPALFGKVVDKLQDFGEQRLSVMDSIGIQKSILSLAGPGVQAEPIMTRAVDLARKANDFLAESIRDNQDRYGGFAHLALQNPPRPPMSWNVASKNLVFRER